MKRIHEGELYVGQYETGALFVGATIGLLFLKAFDLVGFDISASMEWSDLLDLGLQVHAEDAL